MEKILIIEDEDSIRGFLKINLNDKIKFMRFYYLKLIRPFIFIY